MTSPDCASGTDRVAEVARHLPEVDILVNVQGDEPELPGSSIDRVIELLEADPTAVMATLATPIRDRRGCTTRRREGRVRQPRPSAVLQPQPDSARSRVARRVARQPIRRCFYLHIGLYAYRRDFLLQLAALPRTPLEKLENLEQLARAGKRPLDRRGRGARSDGRHRHAGRLSSVRGADADAVVSTLLLAAAPGTFRLYWRHDRKSQPATSVVPIRVSFDGNFDCRGPQRSEL